MELNLLKEQVKSHLSEDKIEVALSVLFASFSNSEIIENVILQSATVHRYNTYIRLGQIKIDDLSIRRNQVIIAVLDILNSLDEFEKLIPNRYSDKQKLHQFLLALKVISPEMQDSIIILNQQIIRLLDILDD